MRSAVVVPYSDYLAAVWTIRCYHCYAECGCCTLFGLPGSSMNNQVLSLLCGVRLLYGIRTTWQQYEQKGVIIVMRSAVVVPWLDYLAALWTIRCYHCYAECSCCTVFGLPGSSTVWTSMAPPGFVLPHPVAFLQQKSDQGCLWNVLWWFKVSQLLDLTIHLTIVRERERERENRSQSDRESLAPARNISAILAKVSTLYFCHIFAVFQ